MHIVENISVSLYVVDNILDCSVNRQINTISLPFAVCVLIRTYVQVALESQGGPGAINAPPAPPLATTFALR